MANSWTTPGACLVILICLFSVSFGGSFYLSVDEPEDTSHADSLASDDSGELLTIFEDFDYDNADSMFIGPIDPTLIIPKILLEKPKQFIPYYDSYISSKSLGDYLRYNTGVFAFQHGMAGQGEMITQSVMLPGLQAIYNGVPVFHQGSYFPIRSGPDMTVLMSDNISNMTITPLSYLNLFAQGHMVSLEYTPWPSEENLSSLTVAQGSFNYERTAWRFSRRFNAKMGAVFTAGFKENGGYYSAGADYDDFRVAGSFVWRPETNIELQYGFYQHKAKQGILQFDRTITPTARSHNDINHHTIKSRYRYSNSLLFGLDLYHQQNYNHLYDDINDYVYTARDHIWGAIGKSELSLNKHNIALSAGWQHYRLSGFNDEPKSSTLGLTLSDSLSLGESRALILTGRGRYNNKTDMGFAAVASYHHGDYTFSGGTIDYEPDIYAMYFAPPEIAIGNQNLISSYTYIPNPGLDSKRILFGSVQSKFGLTGNLNANAGISFEKVYDDLVPVVSGGDSVYTSNQENIDYKRLTATLGFDYNLTKYFTGTSGLTYFLYDPKEALPGIKHSPSLIAFSRGELYIPEVLRDIDLSGAFQARYYAKRYYGGFSDIILEEKEYDPVVVLDGSLAIRFGTFEFRISEDNFIDYFVDNNYTLWGQYSMPPALVWWQFTWNFKN